MRGKTEYEVLQKAAEYAKEYGTAQVDRARQSELP